MKGRDTNALTVTAARPERIRTQCSDAQTPFFVVEIRSCYGSTAATWDSSSDGKSFYGVAGSSPACPTSA